MARYNKYSNILFFMDIETSEVFTDQQGELLPLQVCYLGNIVGIDTNKDEYTEIENIYFRNLFEIKEIFENLSKNKRYLNNGKIIIYCHNLNYELTFIINEFGGNTVNNPIFRDNKNPIRVELDSLPNIEFRDSYCLFNKSVKQLGKDLNLEKLDYNYKILRLPWVELEDIDYKYNYRDNEIVAKTIFNYMKKYNLTVKTMPYTFNGKVRTDRANYIKDLSNKGSKLYFLNNDKKNILNTIDFYIMQMKCYSGGLTCAIEEYIGKFIDKDVYSIDIKSSYPNQLLNEIFPRFYKDTTIVLYDEEATAFFKANFIDKSFYDLRVKGKLHTSKYKGYLANVIFKNIKIKNNKYLIPINEYKCDYQELSYSRKINGKVVEADTLQLGINDVDYTTICNNYNFEDIYVKELYVTTKASYLDESECFYLYKCFLDKETINKEEKPLEYALSKVVINSQYGIKGMKPLRDEISVIDGILNILKINPEEDLMKEKHIELIEKIAKSKNSVNFDILTDAIYTTSYGRYQLTSMGKNLVDKGTTVLYSDTDSLKFFVNEGKSITDIMDIINKFNDEKIKANKNRLAFKRFIEKYELQDDIINKIALLGVWENETKKYPYKCFVTYGAKKYAYIHEYKRNVKKGKIFINEEGNISTKKIEFNKPYYKINTTVAGCGKDIAKAMELYAYRNNISLFEALKIIFDRETMFDESCSGRTISIYEDKKTRNFPYEELTYNGINLNSHGGIVIEPTTYTLDMSEEDYRVIIGYKKPKNNVKRILNNKGELFKNEK